MVDLVIGERWRDSISYRGPRDNAGHGCCSAGALSTAGQQCPVRAAADCSGVTDGGSRGHHGVGDTGCAHGGHCQVDAGEM
jgi:hypothetical protein